MAKESELLPRPDDTIAHLRSVAGMIVVMKHAATDALKKPPYVLDLEGLAMAALSQDTHDILLQPEEVQKPIIELGNEILGLMEDRADLQRKYHDHPEVVKRNLIATMREQLDPEIDVDLGSLEVAWGLFSFGLVFPRKEFEKLERVHLRNGRSASGYITDRFVGPLGPVPIISKGGNSRQTMEHEDLHVLQSRFGFLESEEDINLVISDPRVTRTLFNQDIQSGDLELALEFLNAVANEARKDIIVEFQTNSWEGKIPSSNVLDGKGFGHTEAALSCVINAAFHYSSGLTDKERLETVFYAQKSFNDVNRDRFMLAAIFKESKKTYTGSLPKNEWAAALTLIFTPETSIEVIRAVMLGGRDKHLEKEPERLLHYDLAGAVATYCRRTLDPNSFGQGNIIEEKDIEAFADLVAKTLKDDNLLGDIIKDNGFSEEEIVETRRLAIEYAKKSVPAGKRGFVEGAITSKLNV